MEILSKKNVLVVGATGGIGSEVTKLIKESGANIFISGRDRDKLNKIASQYNIPEDQVFEIDVTVPQQIEAAAKKIHDKIGHVDILINVSGIGIIKSLENLDYEDFSKVVDVNLKGTFNLLKSFVPPMKEAKKGLIINLPGVLGKTPMAGAAAYAASKYGLDGMVKSIREELKRTEVRITNLYLGGTDTPFWDDIDMKVNRDKFVTSREAARAVWFLCQQPSSGVVSEMVLQPFNHQAI